MCQITGVSFGLPGRIAEGRYPAITQLTFPFIAHRAIGAFIGFQLKTEYPPHTSDAESSSLADLCPALR